MPDFAQHPGEQEAILAHAGPPGRLLDVGAADGITFSMSRQLILDGWKAVLVEPSPLMFERLSSIYRDSPQISLVHAAVALQWAIVPFWYSDEFLSTLHAAHREKWAAYGWRGKFFVPTVPLDAVLGQFGPFDLITLDVEGGSADLALTALFHRPRVLIVEHDDKHQEIMAAGARAGYRTVLLNSVNIVLSRSA
jgi:FkbM family methyltransferase